MKRKRFSVEQIVAVLKQGELGMPVAVAHASFGGLADTLPNIGKQISWPKRKSCGRKQKGQFRRTGLNV